MDIGGGTGGIGLSLEFFGVGRAHGDEIMKFVIKKSNNFLQ